MHEAHRLADEIERRWPVLHFLVHCAGVVLGRRMLTADGIETNFAVNYLVPGPLRPHPAPAARLEATGRPGAAARILLVAAPRAMAPSISRT